MNLKKSFLMLSALSILLGSGFAIVAYATTAGNGQAPSGEITVSGEVLSGDGISGDVIVSGEVISGDVTPSGEPTTSGETSGEIVPNVSGEESGETVDPNVLLSTANNSSFTMNKNETLTGAMEATTSGDETFLFAVVTTPTHGTVTQKSSGDPAFTYVPTKDYVGNDSFTFRLESGDKYSNIGTISITIKGPTEPVIPFNYIDMQEHWANYSASHLAARGFVIGEQVGGKYYYKPETNMTRSEFLLFLLSVVDPDNTAKEADVKFADSKEIPDWLLKYAKKAYEMGIIKGVGSGSDVSFYPDKEITRSEAFVMINNALLAKTSITNSKISGDMGFKDEASIPDWAKQAIKTLSDYKIIQGDSSKIINATGLVTRGQAAELSYKLLKELENQAMVAPSGDASGDKTSGEVTPSGDVK